MINGRVINSLAINASAPDDNPVEDVNETAVITSAATDSPGFTRVSETAVITSATTDSPGFTRVGETAVIVSDTYEIRIGADLADTAVLNDSYVIDRLAPVTVYETAKGRDAAFTRRIVRVDVYETAVVESFTTLSDARVDVTDSAVITSSTVIRANVLVDVFETAELNDAASHKGYMDAFETAVITSEAYPREIVRLDVFETAALNDEAYVDGDVRRVDIFETAVVVSRLDSILTAVEDVYEVGYLADQIFSTDGLDGDTGWSASDAWTANVANWAMSRYSDVGIANHDSRFAVSSSGLYERGEVGADMRIETGFLNFGVMTKKRLPHLYLQGSYEGSILVDVTGTVGKQRATHTYTPVAGDTDDPTVVRTDIGKRFSSVYYRFGITSVGRAAMFGGDALVDPIQRRV